MCVSTPSEGNGATIWCCWATQECFYSFYSLEPSNFREANPTFKDVRCDSRRFRRTVNLKFAEKFATKTSLDFREANQGPCQRSASIARCLKYFVVRAVELDRSVLDPIPLYRHLISYSTSISKFSIQASCSAKSSKSMTTGTQVQLNYRAYYGGVPILKSERGPI